MVVESLAAQDWFELGFHNLLVLVPEPEPEPEPEPQSVRKCK